MTEPTARPVAKIKLLKPHEHAHRKYPVGSTLTLPQDKAAWLVDTGVAQEAQPEAAADTAAPAADA